MFSKINFIYVRTRETMTLFQEQIQNLIKEIPQLSRVYYYEQIASTHEQSLFLAKSGAKNGTLLVADFQSQGRGRLQRSWSSPAGKGLYFSLILRPELSVTLAPLLTLATGLAMARVLRAEGLKNLLVKWPNDLWVGKKKLGGILSELGHAGNRVDFVSIGVGLNVSTLPEDFPPELRERATSLQQVEGESWDRAELLSKIIPEMFFEITRLGQQGGAELARRWERESGMLGSRVRIAEQGEERSGQVVGLSDEGRLKIKQDLQETFEVLAGDVLFI